MRSLLSAPFSPNVHWHETGKLTLTVVGVGAQEEDRERAALIGRILEEPGNISPAVET